MIEALATSVTAFVGGASRGPTDTATVVTSWSQFHTVFGSRSTHSHLAFSVHDFFANGGTDAVVVRVGSGPAVTASDLLGGADARSQRRGIYALDAIEVVGMIVIPPYAGPAGMATWDVEPHVLQATVAYAHERHAVVIADAPAAWTVGSRPKLDETALAAFPADPNLAVYLPRLLESDPAHRGGVVPVGASGAVAGVIARADTTKGAWKAPAGRDATVTGMHSLSMVVDDPTTGMLNPLGFNSIRSLPGGGTVVWGARTRGQQGVADPEWTYLPVRRLALMIEASLIRGLQWTAFEDNAAPLWLRVRTDVQAFLDTLWRRGAFAGVTPDDAFWVHCGPDTMTADDLRHGQLRLVVGFAPVKPAEFVVLNVVQATAAVSPA